MTHDKMTHDEAARELIEYRGLFPYTGCGQEISLPDRVMQALDIAIAVLERDGEANKTTDHFRDATKKAQEKAQNTDSVEGITPFDERVARFKEGLLLSVDNYGVKLEKAHALIKDMQAHIRKQNKILSELVRLKQHKDTFGKTPEYLEAMPKVWEEAREAVK